MLFLYTPELGTLTISEYRDNHPISFIGQATVYICQNYRSTQTLAYTIIFEHVGNYKTQIE